MPIAAAATPATPIEATFAPDTNAPKAPPTRPRIESSIKLWESVLAPAWVGVTNCPTANSTNADCQIRLAAPRHDWEHAQSGLH